MESRVALCPKCGRDLGRKRVDLDNEQVVHTYCPSCHTPLVIVHGKGRVTVKARK